MLSNKKTLGFSFLSGLVFATGLIVSLMVDPNKVVSFLSVFHNWDPSLALVMGMAVVVATPGFIVAKRKFANHQPALDGSVIELPTKTEITPQLITGSLIFGIGWGMVGLCPAPALVSAIAGYTQAMLFVVAMFVGFALHEIMMNRK